MRKFFGSLVMLFPFIVILALFTYTLGWRLILYMAAGIFAVLDILGWIMWFVYVGIQIANEK